MAIQERLIEEEMKEAYIDYAMSVITSRALPNVKDGLKPVHRRALFAMKELGATSDKAFKKSARIVGDIIGKYHPHGDTAAYESVVRMAQDFSLRYPLVHGQGNFGSVDGDSPAAQRYTEAKLSKIAEEMLVDIDKDTVDFAPNFDGSLKEPIVLPAQIPNLLINGSTGIAVGMATNIPPHNINEIIDATVAIINNPEIEIDELLTIVQGPDFPTAGFITGNAGIISAYKTGRGKLRIKAKTEIEDNKIIVTELPYQVNKANLMESIGDLVRDKKIDGISDLRDESDRTGIRMVIVLKRDADPNLTLNQLFKHTALKSSFGIIMLSLVNGEPKVLNLKEMLEYFIDHRKEVVVRRTKFDLKKAEDRAHIVIGLKTSLEDIDNVVRLIKAAENPEAAKQGLMQTLTLSEIQAKAILDMKLQKLTSLETNKLIQEYEDLMKFITDRKDILNSEHRVSTIIKEELAEIKRRYGDERRTKIIEAEEEEFNQETLIKEENVVITITHTGYIKQVPLETYRQQRRGGAGIKGAETKEEDFVEQIFSTSNKAQLLFFTSKGKVHWLKAYQVPIASRYSKGKAIVNLIRLEQGERINAILPIKEYKEGYNILFATKKGLLKKTPLTDFMRPRQGGIIAISLREGDELVSAKLTDGDQTIILGTENGQAVKFHESDARPMGRSAAGVRGVTLVNDNVVGMDYATEGTTLLTITENGYGKRTKIDEYRLIKRGGKGVINIQTTERNGKVMDIKTVRDDDEVMIITEKGIIIRVPVSNISTIGRNTQGVTIMRTKEGDKVTNVAKVAKE